MSPFLLIRDGGTPGEDLEVIVVSLKAPERWAGGRLRPCEAPTVDSVGAWGGAAREQGGEREAGSQHPRGGSF